MVGALPAPGCESTGAKFSSSCSRLLFTLTVGTCAAPPHVRDDRVSEAVQKSHSSAVQGRVLLGVPCLGLAVPSCALASWQCDVLLPILPPPSRTLDSYRATRTRTQTRGCTDFLWPYPCPCQAGDCGENEWTEPQGQDRALRLLSEAAVALGGGSTLLQAPQVPSFPALLEAQTGAG